MENGPTSLIRFVKTNYDVDENIGSSGTIYTRSMLQETHSYDKI